MREFRWNQHRDKSRDGAAITTPRQTRLTVYNTGPLHLNEYRFWRSAGQDGMCRNCLAIVKGATERKEHQRKFSCTTTLLEAYELLLRDKKCVICDSDSSQTKWGIPLCKPMCVARWQFEAGAGAPPLRQALELIRLRSVSKL